MVLLTPLANINSAHHHYTSTTYTDLDECHASSGGPGCEQECVNTEGSYYCTCGALYALNDNGHGCDGATTFFALSGSIGGVFIVIIVLLLLGFFVYKCRSKSTTTTTTSAGADPAMAATSNPL